MFKHQISFSLFIFLIFIPQDFCAQAVAFDQLLEQANQNNASLQAQKANVVQKRSQYLKSKSKFLPTLGFSGGHFYYEAEQRHGKIFSFNVQQRILNLTAHKEIALAKLEQQLAEKKFAATQHGVHESLLHDYAKQWLLQEQKPLLSQMLQAAEQSQLYAKKRCAYGFITDVQRQGDEVFWWQAAAKNSKQMADRANNLVQLQLDVGDSQNMKFFENVDLSLAQDLRAFGAGENLWQQRAVAINPQVAAAQLQVEIEKINLQLTKGALWPEVSAQLKFEQRYGAEHHKHGLQVSVGVILQWNLCEWITYQFASDAALAKKIKAEYELAQRKALVKTKVTQKLNSLANLQEQTLCAQKREEAQGRLLAQQRARFKAGLINAQELAQAESSLSQASLESLEAKSSCWQMQKSLELDCGLGLRAEGLDYLELFK